MKERDNEVLICRIIPVELRLHLVNIKDFKGREKIKEKEKEKEMRMNKKCV